MLLNDESITAALSGYKYERPVKAIASSRKPVWKYRNQSVRTLRIASTGSSDKASIEIPDEDACHVDACVDENVFEHHALIVVGVATIYA